MKKASVLVVLLVAVSYLGWSQADTPKYNYDPVKPDTIQYEIQTKVAKFLNDYHYKKFVFDDTLSSKVWDNYLEGLDGSKLYFTQADIDGFEKYRYTIDEALVQGGLDGVFDVFNSFRAKYKKRADFIQDYLSKPLDFNTGLSIVTDRDSLKWVSSEAELDQEWEKILLNQAVSLKLAGDSDSTIAVKLKNRFSVLEKRIASYKAENAFQFFMNAFAEYLDPHTTYMIPSTADQFNISMSQSIEGIGASLQNEGDYVTIKSIVPGGPLFKSGLGSVDDHIVAVAQGDDGEFEDIVGWLVDDAIKIIRGKKGSVVRLKLLASSAPLGSTPRTIHLVREKINLEDGIAKGNVVDLKHEKRNFKLGIIDIPLFYRDFEYARSGGEFQSTTADVRKILEDFNKQKVDGVLIDLRNNGGGSLIEAVDLTGLFIKDGPVVQRKSSIAPSSVESDTDKSIVFGGPLVVLQNRFSASASEIFAGAIQDYQRGLVIGENSYGKGTVQQLVPLDNYFARTAPKKSPAVGVASRNPVGFGQLKFTVEKFYRVNGQSTQIKGVQPDIALPSPFKVDEMGESTNSRALPYDEVRPVSFQKVGMITPDLVSKLSDKYQKRLKTDPELKELLQELDEYNVLRARKEFSLNYEVRKKEKEEQEGNKKSMKKLTKSQKEEDKQDDIYLLEGEKILSDMISMQRS